VDFRTLLGPRLGYIVTTLPAKAGRVSGNACGDPLRSRLKAPSEPQYVLCGVNVPLGYVATRAVVQPIRELVLDLRKCTALATRLSGVLRVNRDHSHPSLFPALDTRKFTNCAQPASYLDFARLKRAMPFTLRASTAISGSDALPAVPPFWMRSVASRGCSQPTSLVAPYPLPCSPQIVIIMSLAYFLLTSGCQRYRGVRRPRWLAASIPPLAWRRCSSCGCVRSRRRYAVAGRSACRSSPRRGPGGSPPRGG
jgi:hypothetical protein